MGERNGRKEENNLSFSLGYPVYLDILTPHSALKSLSLDFQMSFMSQGPLGSPQKISLWLFLYVGCFSKLGTLQDGAKAICNTL